MMMSKRQFLLGVLMAAVFGGLVVLGGLKLMWEDISPGYTSIEDKQKVKLASYDSNSEYTVPEGLNFIHAAEKVTPGVVHIRSMYGSGNYSNNPLDNFFRPYGGGSQAQSSGSGVIVSSDGYIVTNNHVIENASKIEVVLDDNRSYDARVIGTDIQTDLALLKVDATNLQFVEYGDSDNVKVGEWVLAVGNPFNLTSTVTAGIVSAKARNIGILRNRSNLQIESFIQTDAAVNPGNSGGALINLDGKLIGINTAIATPTGSYAGYSFAVPVTLVKKVINDLLEFGKVQRGLLGIRINDVNAQIADQLNLDVVQGVYVGSVNDNSAAQEAGIEAGDVIVGINKVKIDNVAQLQEIVARNRPGDQVEVSLIRKGKNKLVKATLKNNEGNTQLVYSAPVETIDGATFENLTASELEMYNLEGGVKLTDVGNGKWKEAGIEKGLVITGVDKTQIHNVEELNRVMENKDGGVLIEGFYQQDEKVFYGLGW